MFTTNADGGVVKFLPRFTGVIDEIRWAPRDAFLRLNVSEASNRTATTVVYDVSQAGDVRRAKMPARDGPRVRGLGPQS